MKKFLSLALALMMILSLATLTACEQEPKEMLEAAAAALEKAPYKMTMKMNFSSDNEEMNEIFEMMNMEIPVTVDGDNLSMDMTMDMGELLGGSMTAHVVLFDKVMYYDMAFGALSMKMKTTLNDEQLAEFAAENGVEMPVDYEQFANFTAEKKDGKTVISCTGITEEGKKLLNEEIAGALASMDGSAEMGDLTYTITLADGKYESMDLSCTYTVTVAGESVSVTMVMGSTFAYDDVAAIAAPADADSYEEVDYSDLLG